MANDELDEQNAS